MIGLDTNILVRYLVQDDPKQSKKVNALIQKLLREGKTLAISLITLYETVWVLERCYDLNKQELLQVLTHLLKIKQLWIENEPVVKLAINDFEKNKAGFSDCLIGRQNIHNGCLQTYTFDKTAAKLDSFSALSF